MQTIPTSIKLVEAAVIECPDIPIALHLDHGPDFETCKSCIDGGFYLRYDRLLLPSVRGEHRGSPRRLLSTLTLTALLSRLSSARWLASRMTSRFPLRILPTPIRKRLRSSLTRPAVDSLAIAIGTSHGAYKFTPEQCTRNAQAFCSASAALRRTRGSFQASAGLPDRSARLFLRTAGVC